MARRSHRRPDRSSPANVVRFRRRPAARRPRLRLRALARQLTPIMVMLPLASFTAVLLWDGPPFARALDLSVTDRETARFARCAGPVRESCVVDGDTFWYRGEKIRIADINTPETGNPRCASEAELGEKATRRLTALLNAGPFSLEPVERETDRYGRTLRVVTRGGESLGDALVAEGLAEEWQGYRGGWC